MDQGQENIFDCDGFSLCGWDSQYSRAAFAVFLAFTVILFTVWRRRLRELNRVHSREIVVVTGCDTGIGLALAHYCATLGYIVVAGVLQEDSKGATLLRQFPRVHVVQLDVTDDKSVRRAVEFVEDESSKPGHRLAALINNAGVLVFGEFSWQTDRQIRHQLAVNVEGTLRVTKRFLPILRRDGGRIIVVSSHCAEAALPALSVYSATKAALQAWADGLRVEEAQYGVEVVQFVPGSFVMQTSLLASHAANAAEQRSALSREDQLNYGVHFQTFHSYMNDVASKAAAVAPSCWDGLIRDPNLLSVFTRALLRTRPSRQYVNAPLRYTLYHTLFRLCPLAIRDQLVVRFAALPRYCKNNTQKRTLT